VRGVGAGSVVRPFRGEERIERMLGELGVGRSLGRGAWIREVWKRDSV